MIEFIKDILAFQNQRKIKFLLKAFINETFGRDELNPENAENLTAMFDKLQMLRAGGVQTNSHQIAENSLSSESGTISDLL